MIMHIKPEKPKYIVNSPEDVLDKTRELYGFRSKEYESVKKVLQKLKQVSQFFPSNNNL